MAKKRFEPKAVEVVVGASDEGEGVQTLAAESLAQQETKAGMVPVPAAGPLGAEPPSEPEEVRSIEDLAGQHGQVIHADQMIGAGMELPEDVRSILAEIPVVKNPGKLGYAAHEPDVRFDGRQAKACKALTEGLAKAGAKLANGKAIAHQRDAVCWIMERIADCLE